MDAPEDVPLKLPEDKPGGRVGNGEVEVKRVDTVVFVFVVPIREIGVALLVEGVSLIIIFLGC